MGFAQENFNFLADIGLNSEPILNCSLVLGHKEFLGGVGTEFDIGNTEFKSWKVALGWSNETATLNHQFLVSSVANK